ncbi:ParB/RepB/Spo0J family partition protein [Anaerotignum sp.]
MAVKKKGLGAKGLGINALINTEMEDMKASKPVEKKKTEEAVLEVELDLIEPNRKQPRKYFDEAALEELAASLKTYGMIQPIVVKKNGEYYEIIAGERRWRAAKIAGLVKVPVVIKKWEEGEAFEAALVENLQREDLNPMEEAESYQRLQEEFGLSQEKIAEKVGKSRSAITNSLRLLQLDPRVRNFVVENKLTGGHARTLLPVINGDEQFELAEYIIEEGLSVRAVEALVKAHLEKAEKPAETEETLSKADEREYRAIEDDLKSLFSTKVKLKPLGKRNKGKIEIEYYSDEDLERLLALLKR